MDTGTWTSLPERVVFKEADCAWHFGRNIKRDSREGKVGGVKLEQRAIYALL